MKSTIKNLVEDAVERGIISRADAEGLPAPADSAFLKIDAALEAGTKHARELQERLERAAELDPDDPEYIEIEAWVKASRAEDEKRAKRLKRKIRPKSPDAKWRSRRLAGKEKPLRIHRVCWSCRHLDAEHWPGSPGYSEYTPGSPESFTLECRAGHFTTEQALADRRSLATLLTRAAKCEDYELDPSVADLEVEP